MQSVYAHREPLDFFECEVVARERHPGGGGKVRGEEDLLAPAE